MKTLVKNGVVVNSEGAKKQDILILNDCIIEIADTIVSTDVQVCIDATGKYVLPGGIDAHTHFDLQSGDFRTIDNYYSASIAAAYGGTTSIIDHLSFGPKECTLQSRIDEYHQLANGVSCIDYSFHGVIQSAEPDRLAEIDSLISQGITSFKIYLTYDFKLSDEEILAVMEKIQKVNGLITVHAENDGIIKYLQKRYLSNRQNAPIFHAKSRPDYCEAEAIWRLIQLAKLAGNVSLYIVHLSSKKGLDIIRYARSEGYQNIYVESCPQYLLLTDDYYLRDDGLKYILSPPLRKAEDLEALWLGICENEIDVIGTDHCPFSYAIDKQYGLTDFTRCPNGIPGVEERFMLLFSEGVMKKRISIQRFVDVISSNPAKLFGLYGKKGDLKPGFDADIVIVDPSKKTVFHADTIHSAVDYTVYDEIPLTGKIEAVLLRGKLIVNGDTFLGEKGDGYFLQRELIFNELGDVMK